MRDPVFSNSFGGYFKLKYLDYNKVSSAGSYSDNKIKNIQVKHYNDCNF